MPHWERGKTRGGIRSRRCAADSTKRPLERGAGLLRWSPAGADRRRAPSLGACAADDRSLAASPEGGPGDARRRRADAAETCRLLDLTPENPADPFASGTYAIRDEIETQLTGDRDSAHESVTPVPVTSGQFAGLTEGPDQVLHRETSNMLKCREIPDLASDFVSRDGSKRTICWSPCISCSAEIAALMYGA